MSEVTDPDNIDARRSIVELGASLLMSAGTFIEGAMLYEDGRQDGLSSFAEAAVHNPAVSIPMCIMAASSVIVARASGRHSR